MTTDRTAANKGSWKEVEEAGVKGGGDTVHTHASITGDLYKNMAFMEACLAIRFLQRFRYVFVSFLNRFFFDLRFYLFLNTQCYIEESHQKGYEVVQTFRTM